MFHCWSLNEVLAVMVTWGLEGHYGLALLASSSVSGDPWERHAVNGTRFGTRVPVRNQWWYPWDGTLAV